MALPEDTNERIFHVLHLSALAYCGDRWSDLRRWLKERSDGDFSQNFGEDVSWDNRLLSHLYECWIRLLRKDKWEDLDSIGTVVAQLREEQRRYEPEVLNDKNDAGSKALAFRLVSLYHWARATELLALYMLQGEPNSITTELNQHFEASLRAAMASKDLALEILARWLHAAAQRMVAGSLWQMAQVSNSRIVSFITNATKNQALFELLPPQQTALREQGILDQANRAIVVDMPTSGGKTILAEFRILQALNQFDRDDGWVAYVAPTRALVTQLARRLREDLGPTGIQVEQGQVSGLL